MFETAGSCTVQTCSMFKQFRLMSINAKIMQRLRFAALPFRDCFRLFSRPEARQSQTPSADWQARASFNRQKTFITKLNEGK
jgi:hypothetical protein